MLRILNQIQYVPLKQVNIQSRICSFAADVTITQIFRNDKYRSVETIYYFPIEEQAAIYHFKARINNREIIAQIKEISFEDNDDSILFEKDYFIINIGILPPLKECRITISYVIELDLIQGSTIRFVIPTSIAPRYNPLSNKKSKYIQSIPYKIEFRSHIEKLTGLNQQDISRINSPSHPVDIDRSIEDVYIVTFTQTNTYLDRDIILDIKLSDKRVNTCIVLESNAAMGVITPLENDCCIELINEFIFIIDCSKSMKNENKIGLAREMMLEFLPNLPKSSYFNIIKFGTKYTCLFNQSTAFYNHINIQIAEKFISQIRADLDRTEILGPLQWLECHPPQTGRTRQVFLLTDGEISNVSEVFKLCRSIALSTRIFSFGLGKSPNRFLLKSLALTTNGRFIFIPPDPNINIYVKEQLLNSIQHCITNIHIQWNLGGDIQNIPNQISSVYMNDRSIIYALRNNQTIPLNYQSSIEIRSDQSYYRLGITESNRVRNNKQMIARLAAKALIFQLGHSKILRKDFKQVRFEHIDDYSKMNEIIPSKENIKQCIINLSLRYNILSPYTTFIGIEKRLNNRSKNGSVHEIPIQIYRSINSRITKTTSRYPSITFMNQRFVNTSIHVKNPFPKQYVLTNDNNTCYYRKQDPPEHVQLHRDMFTPVTSSTPMQTLSSMDDKDIVRYLINNQTITGLWNFDSNRRIIKNLTGKSLSIFQSSETHDNSQILITVIIIILFEVKFLTLRSFWDDAVEKARQSLIQLLNNDWKKFVIIFRDIRNIFNG